MRKLWNIPEVEAKVPGRSRLKFLRRKVSVRDPWPNHYSPCLNGFLKTTSNRTSLEDIWSNPYTLLVSWKPTIWRPLTSPEASLWNPPSGHWDAGIKTSKKSSIPRWMWKSFQTKMLLDHSFSFSLSLTFKLFPQVVANPRMATKKRHPNRLIESNWLSSMLWWPWHLQPLMFRGTSNKSKVTRSRFGASNSCSRDNGGISHLQTANIVIYDETRQAESTPFRSKRHWYE